VHERKNDAILFERIIYFYHRSASWYIHIVLHKAIFTRPYIHSWKYTLYTWTRIYITAIYEKWNDICWRRETQIKITKTSKRARGTIRNNNDGQLIIKPVFYSLTFLRIEIWQVYSWITEIFSDYFFFGWQWIFLVNRRDV